MKEMRKEAAGSEDLGQHLDNAQKLMLEAFNKVRTSPLLENRKRGHAPQESASKARKELRFEEENQEMTKEVTPSEQAQGSEQAAEGVSVEATTLDGVTTTNDNEELVLPTEQKHIAEEEGQEGPMDSDVLMDSIESDTLENEDDDIQEEAMEEEEDQVDALEQDIMEQKQEGTQDKIGQKKGSKAGGSAFGGSTKMRSAQNMLSPRKKQTPKTPGKGGDKPPKKGRPKRKRNEE